jgi:GT2 family glycosyltransferase
MTSRATADITPVLVTYNSAGILGWSLPSLSRFDDVVIVDNQSHDTTADVARSLLPQARVIRADGNLGFGRANNLGIAQVRTPYALLINPDAQLQDGAIEALHAAARRYPEAAILAPVLYDEPGVVGDFFRGPFHVRQHGPRVTPEGDLCAEFVTGAAMLLNLDAMRGIGFFDPWFFLYFEDDDLCMRVRRAGRPIMVVHDAAMLHRTRQSSTPSARTTLRRVYCMTLSKFYITRKYFGTAACIGLVLRVGVGSLVTLPLQLLAPRKERLLRHVARIGAALGAWRHLSRAHCFEPAD